MNASYLERHVHRQIRWVPAWFLTKAPVRLIIILGGKVRRLGVPIAIGREIGKVRKLGY